MRSSVVLVAISLAVLACGPKPATSLVRLDVEPAGEECAVGGVAIRTGIDENNDRKLTDDEVNDSAYVCHGAPRVPEVGEDDVADEPSALEALLQKADDAMRDSNWEEGLALCKEALVAEPGNVRANTLCAIAACNLKDGEQANAFLKGVQGQSRQESIKQICRRLNVVGFDE